jgi:hypothetical protein
MSTIVRFFIFAAFFMLMWNFTIPRIVTSIDSTYDTNAFSNIDYKLAMTTTILIYMIEYPNTIFYFVKDVDNFVSILNKSKKQ